MIHLKNQYLMAYHRMEVYIFLKKINALKDVIFNITSLSNKEIGFLVMKDFVNDEIPERKLKCIINKTINFDFPLKNIDSNIFSFELFHGPTLAFKDVGASFLANSLEYFTENNILNILVATSGDTGAAVAESFHKKKKHQCYSPFSKRENQFFQQKQISI